ncbi:4Fe-4S dicluster domain-containing protein [Desulfobacula sp.]|uniref:4Fe-4S dicluster domain-containing protein n=1 Tax=Desulfobacula sp. TaxID=2593537 RepID=UPI0026077F16|nr:4Fe-4S dicluster domain-containing protein [Desulfobacula sp.]
MMTIQIFPEKCSGCTRCEVNCSFFHTGATSRNRARVRVVKIEEIGVTFPIFCRQCKEKYCTQCPESAIKIGELGQVFVSPTTCVGCGICQTLCPVGAIELYNELPYICDLCGGSPRCVNQCVSGAIAFVKDITEPVSLKKYKKRNKGKSPEQKRIEYALDFTSGTRIDLLSEGRG